MKRLFLIAAGFRVGTGLILGVAAFGAPARQSTASNAPRHSTIMIRHQMRGCHSWSVNGGVYKPSLSTNLASGGTITFVDNDIMPHKLIQKSGPAAVRGKRNMNHMSASVKVVFSHPGTYRFVTKAGEDYPSMSGMKTIGEDNHLRLTVTVS
jgi:plastocyanin